MVCGPDSEAEFELMDTGCDDWHRWSHFWPLNYVLYILFAVRLPQTPTLHELISLDGVCINVCESCQIICAVCRRLGHL